MLDAPCTVDLRDAPEFATPRVCRNRLRRDLLFQVRPLVDFGRQVCQRVALLQLCHVQPERLERRIELRARGELQQGLLPVVLPVNELGIQGKAVFFLQGCVCLGEDGIPVAGSRGGKQCQRCSGEGSSGTGCGASRGGATGEAKAETDSRRASEREESSSIESAG